MSDTGSGPASPDDLFVELAGRVADAAGTVIMKYFRAPMEVSAKPDQSPVTVADGEAEKAMRGLIEDAFPDHGIIGEEIDNRHEDAEFV